MKTIDYLELIKKTYRQNDKPLSDNKLSQLLNIGRSAIHGYRNHNKTFSDNVAIKVSELLQIDPRIVLTDMNIERSERANHDESVTIWKSIKNHLEHATTAGIIAVILSCGFLVTPENSEAYNVEDTHRLNIMLNNLLIIMLLMFCLFTGYTLAQY